MSGDATIADPREAGDDRRTMIRLEELTKRFPDGTLAVDSLTLEIPEGDICVLVGPSGCGKTTTMKMVNRLVEPTSGRIFLEGDDVTDANPDRLRRRIGYAIQQIGLFPHMTIADNIATVPGLLGWDRDRIRARVDELIDLVGMDPATHRGRYPRELSGGQQQRVGVARAMAADPPVMLMDEPFGATDPITRERLQNEFLRIQEEVEKTILFVTHDIDEAIKMGDRIAILREHSRVAQYDTPETILTGPANDFVEDFIGAGASLKRLNLSRVRDVAYAEDWPVAYLTDDREAIARKLESSGYTAALLLDDRDRPQRWVNLRDLTRDDPRPLPEAGLPAVAVIEPGTTLSDALNEMLVSNAGCVTVVDEDGRYRGIVDIETIIAAIREMREATTRYLASHKGLDPGDDEGSSAGEQG